MMYNYNNWGGGDGYGHWSMMSAGWGGHEWVLGALALAAPIILLFILWTVVWKGLALWHAARRGQYWWFVILLVVNTLGILEIIYLFFVSNLHWRELFSVKEHHHDH